MTEIEQFKPCKDAIDFRRKYNSFVEAWNNCPRGDWMLWIAESIGVNYYFISKAKKECYKTVENINNSYALLSKEYSELETIGDAYRTSAAASYATHAFVRSKNSVRSSKRARKEHNEITAKICRDILTMHVLIRFKQINS